MYMKAISKTALNMVKAKLFTLTEFHHIKEIGTTTKQKAREFLSMGQEIDMKGVS